jgi:hypothetical protein
LLEEILQFPDVPGLWNAPPLGEPALPIVPVGFREGERSYRFFSTVTTLGTPQDITAQEIRIECFYAADAQTEENMARLARDSGDR